MSDRNNNQRTPGKPAAPSAKTGGTPQKSAIPNNGGSGPSIAKPNIGSAAPAAQAKPGSVWSLGNPLTKTVSPGATSTPTKTGGVQDNKTSPSSSSNGKGAMSLASSTSKGKSISEAGSSTSGNSGGSRTSTGTKFDKEQEGLVQSVSKLGLADGREQEDKKPSFDLATLPERPTTPVDTTVTTFPLSVNCFGMLLKPNGSLHRYSVIWPEMSTGRKWTKHARDKVFQSLKASEPTLTTNEPFMAWDNGGLLFTSTMLPGIEADGVEYRSTYGRNDAPCQVKIKYDCELKYDDLVNYVCGKTPYLEYKEDYIHALNVVVQKRPRELLMEGEREHGYHRSGDNSWFPTKPSPDLVADLGLGASAVRGYFASVRLAPNQLVLNVNTRTSPFYTATSLVNVIGALRSRKWTDTRIESFLKGVKIESAYLRDENGRPLLKTKTVEGFVWENKHAIPERAKKQGLTGPITGKALSSNTAFIDVDNQILSVAEYFRKNHNSRGQGLDNVGFSWPCIHVASGLETPVWLPAELCRVKAGQPYRQPLEGSQTEVMLKHAARTPQNNVDDIPSLGLKTFGLGNDSNFLRTNFGVKVTATMIEVKAKQHAIPKIGYGGNKMVEFKSRDPKYPPPRSWNLNRMTFKIPRPLPKWCVISVDCGKDHDTIAKKAPIFGQLLQPYFNNAKKDLSPTVYRTDSPLQPTRSLGESLSASITTAMKAGVVLCLVVLPGKDAKTYASVKALADVKFGINCVCITRDKFRDADPGLAANIAMKMNLKLGGANHVRGEPLPLHAQKTLFIGLDITHPAPGSKDKSTSIAAMVGNLDETLAQWPGELAALSIAENKSSQETVDRTSLQKMFKACLDRYVKKNKRNPEKVFIYRDGVSEGEYDTVINQELRAIQEVCKNEQKPGEKAILTSLVIVAKRHHIRAFKVRKQGNRDVAHNPDAGTMFDQTVSMERGWDFYLQAHKPLQGTGKPAHYVVLHDEVGLRAGELEKFTHDFCYLFGRSSLPVSLAPPVFYAHLLAARGRAYLHEPMTGNGQIAGVTNAFQQGVHQNIRETMFYI